MRLKTLAKEGVECDVIDLRTLSPIDMETVLESVEKHWPFSSR